MSAHPSRGLALRGLILIAVFAAVHFAGLREFLPLLCGSTPPGGHSRQVQAICCVIYLVFYFSAVLVAPVLLLASALLRLKK